MSTTMIESYIVDRASIHTFLRGRRRRAPVVVTPALSHNLTRVRQRNYAVVYGAHEAPPTASGDGSSTFDHLEVSTTRPSIMNIEKGSDKHYRVRGRETVAADQRPTSTNDIGATTRLS